MGMYVVDDLSLQRSQDLTLITEAAIVYTVTSVAQVYHTTTTMLQQNTALYFSRGLQACCSFPEQVYLQPTTNDLSRRGRGSLSQVPSACRLSKAKLQEFRGRSRSYWNRRDESVTTRRSQCSPPVGLAHPGFAQDR